MDRLTPQGLDGGIAQKSRINAPISIIGVERWVLNAPLPGKPGSSVIVKSLPQGMSPGSRPPSFLEELVCYRFLTTVRDDFALFPELYFGSDSLFILEDLGPDAHDYASAEEACEWLARTLAGFHAATAGHRRRYDSLRAEAGLAEDGRVWSQAEQTLFFRIGLDYLACFPELRRFPDLMEHAVSCVNAPGPFLAFIHDDLAARRQTVSASGGLYLLDFETGKFGHCLLDVLKPILGKVERKSKLGKYFLNSPGLPVSLFETYRGMRNDAGGAFAETAEWNTHWCACAVFLTVANIGVAIRAGQTLPSLEGFGNVVAQALHRLATLLDAVSTPAYGPLAPALRAVIDGLVHGRHPIHACG